jgi:hypothetical protein
MMPRGVFISYSSEDREFARRLAQDLVEHEIPVWFAESELEPGDSLFEKIEAGIDRAEFLLVVLTPDSVDSRWVQEEVRMAMHKGIPGRKASVLLIDKVLRGNLAESDWEKEVARIFSSSGNPGSVFDQRGRKADYQVNIGSLNIKIPVFPGNIESESLKEAEVEFRGRIKRRFEEDTRYYTS